MFWEGVCVHVACQGFIRLLMRAVDVWCRENTSHSRYFPEWIIGEFDKNYDHSLTRLMCQQHDNSTMLKHI